MNTALPNLNEMTADPISGLLEQIRQRHDQLAAVPLAPTAIPVSDQAGARSYFRHLRSWFREQGVFPEIAEEIIDHVRHSSTRSIEEDIQCVEGMISRRWHRPRAAESGEATHLFVGPPGSGKTTVLSKWLAQLVLLEERTTRVFRLDSSTANTAEALSIYGEVLGVPVLRSQAAADPLPPVEITFVDLPGADCEISGGLEQIKEHCGKVREPIVHLVLNAAYETIHLLRQIEAFSALSPSDIIFTHLDEERRWGKLINFLWKSELPLRWLGVGQNVPGGLLEAAPAHLIPERLP
jgi:flagellar biosynthesis protein FlhF